MLFSGKCLIISLFLPPSTKNFILVVSVITGTDDFESISISTSDDFFLTSITLPNKPFSLKTGELICIFSFKPTSIKTLEE